MRATFSEYTGGKSRTVEVRANKTLSIEYDLRARDGMISLGVSKDGALPFTATNGESGTKTFTPGRDAKHEIFTELRKDKEGKPSIKWNAA